MQEGSIMALSPSFSSYSSSRFAEIAAKVTQEFNEQREELGLEACFVEENQRKPSDLPSPQPLPLPLPLPPPPPEVEQEKPKADSDDDDDEDDDDFEFSFVSRDAEPISPISADEIFYNGQIKPIYPVFNRNLLFAGGIDVDDEEIEIKNKESGSNLRFPLRKLLIEERDPPSSSSSEADEVEGLPAGTYCVWTPKSVQASPEMAKKSNSTGSSKRWRFRDFLRSNSDGKDTFVFLTHSTSNSKNKSNTKKGEKGEKVEKLEVPKERRKATSETTVAGKAKGKVSGEGAASAHEIHYMRNRALKEGDKRRSYLPYRQDLVGFFANVNGVSRNLHPF